MPLSPISRSELLRLAPAALLSLTALDTDAPLTASARPSATVPASAADPATVLKTLRAGHPRLIITDDRLAEIKQAIQTNATAKRYAATISTNAAKILTQPPVEYKLIGPRLLDKSRTCLSRIYYLATMYRLDGDPRWLERAKKELFAVAAFPDWHPFHFLDTAEMTHAVAIGYDWLYTALTPDERTAIRTALVRFGLGAGLDAYAGKGPTFWWVKNQNNWNLVCNGGLSLGALAVADEEPVAAASVLASALRSAPLAMKSYAPDGGWIEGPGYWGYATQYAVAMCAGLMSALGTDFGLSDIPAFDRAGVFRTYFTGPIGLTFNYADAGDRAGDMPEMRWLARRFHQPLFAWEANRSTRRLPEPLDLLWFDPVQKTPKETHAPLDNIFRAVDVALLRSAWDDPNALFVGFKGGDNDAAHAHLDLGTFVFDALGERWVSNLGGDNYNLPDYFGKLRWSYYRLATVGQNTFLLNDSSQTVKAKAPLVAYSTTPDSAYAVADLKAGWAAQGATRVHRGVALVNGRTGLLVQDEFETTSPVDYRWQVFTRATIAASGASATLSLNGKTLKATLLGPEGATFAAESAAPPPINGGSGPQQNPNTGYTRLTVHLPSKVGSARVCVLLAPAGAAATTSVRPLTDWIHDAPPLPDRGGIL